MPKVIFGKSWFRARRQLTQGWDEDRARIAHDKRQAYAAAIESDTGAIRCFIEANNDCIGVGFLDDAGREYLSYEFQEIEPQRLFLTMATHRDFDGPSDHVTSGTTYYFKPDGRVTIETEDFSSRAVGTKETKADVAPNWDMYPAFASYESLLRINR